jgi:hypothetical protein
MTRRTLILLFATVTCAFALAALALAAGYLEPDQEHAG